MADEDTAVVAPETAAEPEFKPVDLDAKDAQAQLDAQELPEGDDAAPADKQPSGETKEPEPAEEPPIEAPKSWKKDEKERFQSLPRETQTYLAEREQERDREVRRSQNEAADKLKALAVREQAVEQARQQYEATLPQLAQLFQQQQAGEFSDIKTIQDVEKLAREDWPRYLQWDVSQKKIAAAAQEMQMVQQRQAQERMQQFSEFATKEDSLFAEKVPEMADKEKAVKLQQAAVKLLKDVGFDDTELAKTWGGESALSLRDHRVQLLIRDATLWREAQTRASTAVPKLVPKPQSSGSGGKGVDDLRSAAEKGDMEAFVALRAKGVRR